MLDTEELAAMREDAEEALPDRATIERATRTGDGEGGKVLAWAAVAADVPCRLDPLANVTDAERRLAEQLTTVIRGKVTLPAGQDIGEKDRIAIAGTTYEVRAVVPREAWEITRVVLVSEVRP